MARFVRYLALALAVVPLDASRAQVGPTRPHTATRVDARQLGGTWKLLTVDNILADGRRIQPYGAEPVGRMTLDPAGRYAVQIFQPGRARFAASDKARGTAEENRATVQGTNSHFGRYAVDEAARTITFRIEHASFPNWEGTEQRRVYTLRGDTLRYTVRTTTTGGSEVGEVTWLREP